ncbi:MAG: TfoX/Sxy family protein [Gammaproteobacteria bacterium]|nr:TfoX/Sxy family protein [Gammaproteobacteria bacterium]
MTQQSEFVEFVIEQLAPSGEFRARAMFGGYGIYQGDTMFAIIVDDQLYFKADGITCKEFTERGLNPFTYSSRGKTVTMQYYEAPPEVFDELDAMQSWVQQAVKAALRTKRERKSSKPASQRTRNKSRAR